MAKCHKRRLNQDSFVLLSFALVLFCVDQDCVGWCINLYSTPTRLDSQLVAFQVYEAD